MTLSSYRMPDSNRPRKRQPGRRSEMASRYFSTLARTAGGGIAREDAFELEAGFFHLAQEETSAGQFDAGAVVVGIEEEKAFEREDGVGIAFGFDAMEAVGEIEFFVGGIGAQAFGEFAPSLVGRGERGSGVGLGEGGRGGGEGQGGGEDPRTEPGGTGGRGTAKRGYVHVWTALLWEEKGNRGHHAPMRRRMQAGRKKKTNG